MTLRWVALLVFYSIAIVLTFVFQIKGRGFLLAFISGVFLFFILFYQNYNHFQFIALLNLNITFFILDMQDYRDKYVLDWHFYILIGAILLVRLTVDADWKLNFISIAVAFLVLFIPYAVTKGKGLGIGDVIVFGLCGLLLTPVEVLPVFLLTTLTAALWGIGHYIVTRKKSAFALIPFIHIAMLIFLPLQKVFLHLLGLENVYMMQFIH